MHVESKHVTETDVEQLRLLRESTEGFLAKEATPKRLRRLRLENKDFDRTLWRSLAEMGWTGLLVPEEYGGLGLGLSEMAIVSELCGAHLLSEPVVPTAGFATRLLTLCSNKTLKSDLLRQIAGGELVIGVAWQGKETLLTDPELCEVNAHKKGKATVLSGVARFARPGTDCDGYLVSAKSKKDLILCWIPAGSKGLDCQPEQTADGGTESRITMKNVHVSSDHILGTGKNAVRALQQALDETIILSSAELLGVTKKVFEITLEYLKTRVQFGRAIGSFQALQHRAVDLMIQKELASALVTEAVAFAESGPKPKELSATASRVKSRCSDAALTVAREAVQLHGAIGFTEECDVGLYLKRALVLSAWLGNGVQHRRRYASLTTLPKSRP